MAIKLCKAGALSLLLEMLSRVVPGIKLSTHTQAPSTSAQLEAEWQGLGSPTDLAVKLTRTLLNMAQVPEHPEKHDSLRISQGGLSVVNMQLLLIASCM
jgi:hypothetical protein